MAAGAATPPSWRIVLNVTRCVPTCAGATGRALRFEWLGSPSHAGASDHDRHTTARTAPARGGAQPVTCVPQQQTRERELLRFLPWASRSRPHSPPTRPLVALPRCGGTHRPARDRRCAQAPAQPRPGDRSGTVSFSPTAATTRPTTRTSNSPNCTQGWGTCAPDSRAMCNGTPGRRPRLVENSQPSKARRGRPACLRTLLFAHAPLVSAANLVTTASAAGCRRRSMPDGA
jgi:hypothetical protein